MVLWALLFGQGLGDQCGPKVGLVPFGEIKHDQGVSGGGGTTTSSETTEMASSSHNSMLYVVQSTP